MLMKLGHPVVPSSLKHFIVSEIHFAAHFGKDKRYSPLNDKYSGPICMVINNFCIPVPDLSAN